MKIVKPSVTIVTPIDGPAVMAHIEQCGRVCYKSEYKTNVGSAERFIEKLIERGHESVLEHFSVTVKFVVDRGVSHEIVRHRLASYSQESTRYCNYSKDEFGQEITVIEPSFFTPGSIDFSIWRAACSVSEKAYFDLLIRGCSPQEARSVLPNSLKTEVVMTANLREWRHFLKLRTSAAAHPQIREVAVPLLHLFAEALPSVFGDIKKKWSTEC